MEKTESIKKRVFLWGWYGFENLSDDLLLNDATASSWRYYCANAKALCYYPLLSKWNEAIKTLCTWGI